MEAGIETFESCEGGQGHAFPQPTVRFHGYQEEGFRALAVAAKAGLRVAHLRRVWDLIDGEPTGPHWEIVLTLDSATRVRLGPPRTAESSQPDKIPKEAEQSLERMLKRLAPFKPKTVPQDTPEAGEWRVVEGFKKAEPKPQLRHALDPGATQS